MYGMTYLRHLTQPLSPLQHAEGFLIMLIIWFRDQIPAKSLILEFEINLKYYTFNYILSAS